MRTLFLLLLVLAAPLTAGAQTPAPPSPQDAALYVSDAERRYFELGDVLTQGAFIYSPLAAQAGNVTHLPASPDKDADALLAQTAKLAPVALQARVQARALFARAVTLMQQMNAPDSALGPVAQLATHLGKPLVPTGAAQTVAMLNRDAGTVLAALDESDRLSRVLDDKALQRWATGPGSDPAGRVWYGEGLMAGVAGVASALGQPNLLPPPPDLATDLRGLRDWLSLRLPETPTPDQTALQAAIDTFLTQTSAKGRRSKPLTAAQLHDLGEISRLVQVQILPPESPALNLPPPSNQTDHTAPP